MHFVSNWSTVLRIFNSYFDGILISNFYNILGTYFGQSGDRLLA